MLRGSINSQRDVLPEAIDSIEGYGGIMRLTFTRRAAHGIALIKVLASLEPGTKITSAELARRSGVPKGFVPTIVATLRRAGLIGCHPGRSGGCYLTRAPKEVSLLEVVDALDGPLTSTHCVLEGRLCMDADECDVHEYWQKAHEAIQRSLAECTLEDLKCTLEDLK